MKKMFLFVTYFASQVHTGSMINVLYTLALLDKGIELTLSWPLDSLQSYCTASIESIPNQQSKWFGIRWIMQWSSTHGACQNDRSFNPKNKKVLGWRCSYSYSSIINQIILGWAGDRAWVNASLVYAICMGCCGAVTALIPLTLRDYYGICAIAALFGLFIAANYSLTSIILVELITLDRFTNAYGLLLLVQGIANLVGPPLAGKQKKRKEQSRMIVRM